MINDLRKGLKSFKFLVAVLTFAFLLLTSKAALSQTQTYDVTVSPVFFDLTSNPGDTISEKVRIRNNTTSPIPIRLEVKAMGADETGNLTLKNTASDDSLSWIKFSETKFLAKPLEWTDVPFTIDVPLTAAYGYYLAISFTQDDTSPLARTGAKITGAAAVPILLNVKKEGAKAEAKVVSFSTKKAVYEYLPVEFAVKVQNSGNIHVRPRGNVFISSSTGREIAILDVNQAGGNIIPETKRDFNVSWSDGFIVREPVMDFGQPKLDKNGKPLEKLNINWNKLTSFRIGKYTANLLLVYDNGQRDVTLEAALSFWVIPYKAIIVVIATLIVIFFISRYLLRRYIRKQIEKGLKARS